MKNWRIWLDGLKDGIPISLGYIAVSFTFGILAGKAGLSALQAILISATCVTSAGQFSGLELITASASYAELALSQLIINLRYCLMSCALSQKVDGKTRFYHRLLVSFGITDEIFGVSAVRGDTLKPAYNYGLMCSAIPGWVLGTALGVLSGSLLPPRILSALSVALYGMFIAIIIPPARKNRVVLGVVLIAMLLSTVFTYVPGLSTISSGFRVIILTVVISGAAALLFPVKEAQNEE